MTTGDASRPKAGDSHLCANDQGVANIERLTNSPRLPGDPSDAALCKQRGAATEQPDPLRPALGPLDPLSESSVLVPTVATARSPMVPPMLLLQREDSVPQDPETHLFSCHPRRHSHEQRGPVPNMMDWSPLVPMQESAEASTKRGRRRSSLAVIADRIRSSLSLSRSRSRSQSQTRSRESSISHRLSRTFSRHTDGEDEGRSTIEAEGPYRDVKIAQAEFMARLRAEQESKRVTKNVDGFLANHIHHHFVLVDHNLSQIMDTASQSVIALYTSASSSETASLDNGGSVVQSQLSESSVSHSFKVPIAIDASPATQTTQQQYLEALGQALNGLQQLVNTGLTERLVQQGALEATGAKKDSAEVNTKLRTKVPGQPNPKKQQQQRNPGKKQGNNNNNNNKATENADIPATAATVDSTEQSSSTTEVMEVDKVDLSAQEGPRPRGGIYSDDEDDDQSAQAKDEVDLVMEADPGEEDGACLELPKTAQEVENQLLHQQQQQQQAETKKRSEESADANSNKKPKGSE
ncbi:hypothetical protein BGW38_004868 [Lunasporangiospora selenospora]|uniref:Uncharacterized protein n=1 Tax=Lunasporangiospora selenospora TaxID=979761 RepID=A0A9P6G3Z1_9FUNG|nr:hypothetical protein BGW38_004868 [Lunasporangiospora selenospora]